MLQFFRKANDNWAYQFSEACSRYRKFTESEKAAVKTAEVRLVAQAGLSFAVVDNPALRSFAQLMIQIGSKYGNICNIVINS